MTDETKAVTLRVAEAKTRDFGRGIARVDPQIVKELALHTEDVIQIENYVKMSKTAAILWPSYPEDEGTGIIRIDGSIRDNIKVAINERVQLRKIKAQPAEVFELAPIQSRLVVRNEQYFSQLLENRVVTQGDIVNFMIMGQRIEFVVTNFRPKADAVIITLKTKVQVSREPVSEDIKTRAKSRVSYEDIGGLGEEIKKVQAPFTLGMPRNGVNPLWQSPRRNFNEGSHTTSGSATKGQGISRGDRLKIIACTSVLSLALFFMSNLAAQSGYYRYDPFITGIILPICIMIFGIYFALTVD